ncbi:DNA repair protein (plasmid) [Thioflavicoccus mobilis 8321]|uniref:DNA repair protein n=1 Tax=Thioflavicoccus mobilis 8321 TaxID=765912 RepID=L0H3Y4_9GAMM|nr:JAB domain-containing protein [Thioflavicoccus mobilis]AGA92385.1 DNA repair protein [Thioflavicoccus mobilis 8321]
MATRIHPGTALQVQDSNGRYRSASDEDVLNAARSAINRRFRRGRALTSPVDSQEFLAVRLAHLEHEVFAVLWLDNRHRILAFEELFRGTIDGSSVHPREVVKFALCHNAAACIMAHNHSSGVSEPSRADLNTTQRLKDALVLIDVRVLDHIVVGETRTSLAARGLV